MCWLAPLGDVSRAESQIGQLLEDIAANGEGFGLNMVSWCRALLYNGLGRFPEALEAARLGAAEPLELWAAELGTRRGGRDPALRGWSAGIS